MNYLKQIKQLGINELLFLFGLSTLTIIISPWWTYDGFNIPKLVLLVLIGFTVIPNIINIKLIRVHFRIKSDLILVSLFPINLLLVILLNDANKIQQFYGEFGRRTGFLTYVSCFSIFLYSILMSNINSINMIIKVFAGLGVISASYGLIQPYGIIKINALASENKIPYSFFGNIDFNSGFLGLTSIVFLSYLFTNFDKKSKKTYAAISLLIYIYAAIYLTRAQQGFVVSFSGIVMLTLFYFYKSYGSGIKFKIVVSVSLFLATQFILSLFGRGFAARYIYDSSVQARNYYWEAGIKMAIDNPWLGVGMDRYGDWYWAYRNIDTIKFLGPIDFSNSSHSIFIDILSSGGFPLLITYLVLLLVVFKSSVFVFRSKTNYKFEFISLFACWIAFNVYSLISIGQIGVLVWGWIFSGLLIGTKSSLGINIKNKIKKSNGRFFLNVISLTVGLLLIYPVVKESNQIKNAIESNYTSNYLNYLDSNKIEPSDIVLAIKKINDIGLEVDGLKYTIEALHNFPNNYDLWYLLYTNKNSSNSQKQLAFNNLSRLNYYNRILQEKHLQ